MADKPSMATNKEIELTERAIRAGQKLSAQQLEIIKNDERLLELLNQRAAADDDWEAKEAVRRQKRIEALKNEADFLALNLDSQKAYAKLTMDSATAREAFLKKEYQFHNLLIQQAQENLEKAVLEAESDTDKQNAIEEQRQELERLLIVRNKLKVLSEEEEAYNKRGEEAAISFVNAFGIKTHEQQLSMTEGMMIGRLNYEQFGEWMAGFATSGVALQNVMAGFGQKVLESTITMMKALDTLSADMYKLTGGSAELKSELASLGEFAGSSGVSMANMGESIKGLLSTSSNFTSLTKTQREEVARNNAQLVALGVSASTAGKNFSIFTQALGMTVAQANASSRELIGLANNLDMSFEAVTSGFAEAASTVAAYGKNAVGEFAKLAAESKALGLSVQELINIVKGADTFQGAAEQAGKLNAMLGGGLLNSSQLLVASESERIELIRDAVMQTGRSFESMSKYEQIALANAAGIQDLTVAQKLFNQQIDGDELDRYLGKTNALGQTQEEMKSQALAAQSAQEKFAIVMEQFAAVSLPVVELLGGLMSFLVSMGPLLKIISTLFIFWTTVINIHGIATKAYTAFEVARKAAMAASIPVEVAKTGAQNAGRIATIAATFWNWAFKTSIDATNFSMGRMIILGLLVVGALLLIFYVLHKSGSPMLYAIFGFMAIGIFLFGEALNKNKQGILAFGAGMMMVGIGAFMAFHGLEGFATALSKLDPLQLGALVIVIFALTAALLIMFAGLGFLVYSGLGPAAAALLLAFGVSMLLAGAGAMMLGYGLSMVIDSLVGLASNMAPLMMLPIFLQLMALSLITVSVGLAVFTYTLISVGFAMLAAYIPILAVIAAITALSLAINSITPEKSIALKTTTDSVRNFIDTGKEITPETVKNLDTVIEQIHKLNMEASITKITNVTAPFKEIVDAINGQTKANAESDKTVVMKLDDRVFGSAVIKTMNTYGTANTAIRKTTPAGSGS